MALYEIEKNSSGVPTGNYKHVAGRGRAEYGASTVRTGSVTISSVDPGSATSYGTVTFSNPMPDSDYLINLNISSATATMINIVNQNANGFTIMFRNATSIPASTIGDITVYYTAFKLYTDTEYNNILAAMPSDASASNKLVTESDIEAEVFTLTKGDVNSFIGQGIRHGNLVCVTGSFLGVPTSNNLAWIPVGYRPSSAIYGSGVVIRVDNDKADPCLFTAYVDGHIGQNATGITNVNHGSFTIIYTI